jgi:adenylate kinase family enzyme
MTDGSMSYTKFNMGPGSRPLQGEYKKTIIVVVGKSNVGKSTLCEALMNQSINYISMDEVYMRSEYGKREVAVREGHFIDIGEECIKINEFFREQFMDYFFEEYIVNNENLNILLDGFVFTLRSMYDSFLRRCRINEYRVWRIEREEL